MKKQPVLCAIILFFSFNVAATHDQTLTYFENDSIQLELDLFLPDHDSSIRTPLVIYVHEEGLKVAAGQGGMPWQSTLSKKILPAQPFLIPCI